MLAQERLIARVREVCTADERLDAALMYGSFAAGEGDAHSDIEFWLFFDPVSHPRVDPRTWCAQVAPVLHLVRNEFGTDVAFFAGEARAEPGSGGAEHAQRIPGLVRGEFHFATADDIPTVRAWPARGAAVDAMIVLDRHGLLRPALQALPERAAVPHGAGEVESLCGRFVNWLLLAHHVAARGETLRAWDALGHVHRHLLWMARLVADATGHWLTPSRRAERELPPAVVAELYCSTAAAEPEAVRAAVRAAWQLGRRYWTELAHHHGFGVPADLVAGVDAALAAW